MREIIVGINEENQSLYKLLSKYLKAAPTGFIYKMLRKKNITLNDKKAEGKEILKIEDVVKLWLSDETIEKFIGEEFTKVRSDKVVYDIKSLIVFEDKDIIILNKPTGLLSQKAKKDDISINELCLSYLLEKNEISRESLLTFKPSICNRLDRNTSGLIIFGKTFKGSRKINAAVRDRKVKKYYLAIVHGRVDKACEVKGFINKNEKNNKIIVRREEFEAAKFIETAYTPLYTDGKISLLLIRLITGRTHQIRAHLSFIGYPIVGDLKYGISKKDKEYKKMGIENQLLHSYCLDKVANIDGGCIFAEPPLEFKKLLKGYSWELGRPEDLEAQI